MHVAMQRHRTSVVLALAATLTLVGCARGDRPREATADDGAAAAPVAWYRRERTLDLTGDGRADRARLMAVGTHPDSLRLTLSLLVNGEERYRVAWGSSYELALIDPVARLRSGADAVLRAALDSVLASVAVQRLDAPGVRLMAEDSALLAELEPRPTWRVSFSYGYETTVRLAWDAPRGRFVPLWSCC
jgi:hypothetical protein